MLLQRMGWKAGEGLGKNNEGAKEPLMLDFKTDRRGINKPRKYIYCITPIMVIQVDIQQMHWGPSQEFIVTSKREFIARGRGQVYVMSLVQRLLHTFSTHLTTLI